MNFQFKRVGMGMVWAVVGTLGLLALIIAATRDSQGPVPLLVLVSVVALLVFFFTIVPGGGLFAVVLANGVAFYTVLFVFLVATNFPDISFPIMSIGYEMPLIAFLAGVLWFRREVAEILERTEGPDHDRFIRSVTWLVPMVMIASLSFVVPLIAPLGLPPDGQFMMLMAAASVAVFLTSRHVAVFIADTGKLFEDFFQTISRLIQPAFAFLSFYSLVVIVFGCVYRLADKYSDSSQFSIGGDIRDISFIEAIYFSIVTLSTVGYGDVVPLTYAVRLLAAVQIVAGILLVMFGLQAILSHVRK